jgi:superfamily II DNA or RNA helicase/phage FluMu protein Com
MHNLTVKSTVKEFQAIAKEMNIVLSEGDARSTVTKQKWLDQINQAENLTQVKNVEVEEPILVLDNESPGIELRDYQKKQLDFLINSDENTCIQSPTGTGKTPVMVQYINQLLEKGLNSIAVITPSSELVRNIKGYFGTRATMAFSGEIPNLYAPILITTYQSAAKYLNTGLYTPQHVISDECHSSVCDTWKNVIKPGVRHDGFTATPNRLDGKPLSENFSRLYKAPAIQWFIDRKYLAPFNLTICDYPEFYDAHNDSLCTQQEIFGSIPEIDKSVEIYMENSRNSKTMFFVTGVAHGLQLEERLRHYGVDASFIESTTPRSIRNRDFGEFKFGNKKVLININLFTTGIDVPECDAIYACRFSYSPTFHFQIAGRGWRYLPGKTFKYFDLAGNCYYHGSPTMPYPWSLEGDKIKRGSNKESLYHRCYKCSKELILKRMVKDVLIINCPSCKTVNQLFPKTKMGDVGQKLFEDAFKLLKLPSEMAEATAHIISIERNKKMNPREKLMAIAEIEAPMKIKKASLKRLGFSEKAIKALFGE